MNHYSLINSQFSSGIIRIQLCPPHFFRWCSYCFKLQLPSKQAEASITGYILKMGPGEPLATTSVMISPFNAGISESYTATTDAEGDFSFQNLDPGQYRLIATKNGFARMEYGAPGPNKPGLPITLTRGQRLADIGLQLIPGG